MKIDGQNEIAAPPEKVWAALNDPEVLRASIPGCQSLEKTSDTEYKATVKTKVGPVRATFNGQVELTDLNPPTSYTLSGRGAGGAAGSARGVARVRLEPRGDNTLLTYDVDAEVTGKLAQLGSRLILSTTKMLAGKFFDKFEEIVGQPPEAAESAVAEGAQIIEEEEVEDAAADELLSELDAPDPIAPTTAPSTKPAIPAWVWLAGAAAVLSALALLILN